MATTIPDPHAARGESRIRRSWRLTRTALNLLRGDRTLIALAALGGVFAAAASGVILYFGGYFHDPGHSGGHLALVGAIGAYPVTFIAVFFNVALVSAAAAAMEGRHLTVREALGTAVARLGRIAVWALLAAGVGVLLDQIASRLPWGGRVATWLFGAAWSLATIFVVPVLVVEDERAIPAVRRSAALIKQRWGEGLAGSLTIGAWLVVVAIPAVIVLGIGAGIASTNPGTAVVLIVTGVVSLMVMSALASAVREIFALALYRFAVEGTAGVFPPEDLKRPFTPKRGRR